MRVRILVLIVVLCFGFFVTVSAVQAQDQPAAGDPSATMTESLKKFLMTLDNDKRVRYVTAFRDLNGDGIREAIVYMIGRKWCGSGGCDTLILAPMNGSWVMVTKIRITRPPIYVLSDVSGGWHSIGVWVQGGGIQPGYEAELSFDGKTYPINPSIYPARRLEGNPVGEEIITSPQGAKLLYDN